MNGHLKGKWLCTAAQAWKEATLDKNKEVTQHIHKHDWSPTALEQYEND